MVIRGSEGRALSVSEPRAFLLVFETAKGRGPYMGLWAWGSRVGRAQPILPGSTRSLMETWIGSGPAHMGLGFQEEIEGGGACPGSRCT